MKRKLIVIGSFLGIIFLAVMIAGFFSSRKKEEKKIEKKSYRKLVNVYEVMNENQPTYIHTFGRVVTTQILKLHAEVSGRLMKGEIKLKEGENFSKGQMIYQIDDREEKYALRSKKSNLMRDVAKVLPDLKIDFSENFDAWKFFFDSFDVDKDIPELPQPKSDKEKIYLASKGIYPSYYDIKSSEIRLSKYKFFAPFVGSIKQVSLQSGSFVAMGTVIGEVIQTGVNELKVSINANEIPRIKHNTKVEIFSSQSGKKFGGSITRISDFVNENTQSIDVFITILSPQNKVYEGQFFQTKIPEAIIKNAIKLPREAVYDNDNVFVVVDSSLIKKKIDVAKIEGNVMVVVGLNEKEKVVVEQLVGVEEGTKVDAKTLTKEETLNF